MKDSIVNNWDKRISKRITAGQQYLLDGELELYVSLFDFKIFGYKTPEEILDDHRKTAYWAERFLGLLPPPKLVEVPDDIADFEEAYVRCLLDVFEDEEGCALLTPTDISSADLSTELRGHRERFYLADAFAHHYRDETAPGTVEDFAEEIFDAVEPALVPLTGPSRARLAKAMEVAALTAPGSILAPRARVRVKQGVCHQLANASRLKWRLK